MAIPIFPYRNTYLTVNEFLPECQQPLVLIERHAVDVASMAGKETTRYVHLIQDLGWTQRSYQHDVSRIHEATAAQTGILTQSGGFLTVAASHEESDTFAQPPLVGVTFAGAPTTGSPMIQKKIAAGSSFAVALSPDQTAYPSPETSDDIVTMDRVAVGNYNHDPDEVITFRFHWPGHSTEQPTNFMTIYFCGPAGSNSQGVGTGRYALKLLGDGSADLYEKETSSWLYRFKFQWSKPQNVRNGVHTISIHSDAVLNNEAWDGSKIVSLSSPHE